MSVEELCEYAAKHSRQKDKDKEPGPFMGPNWVGKFVVELINNR